MKILVICQYYYPEPFRHNDYCEALVERGHNVTVITGIPNYPMGEIYGGYQNGQRRDEIINGVKVHRCSTIPRKRGRFYRFLNYYSYAFSSTKYVKRLKEEFDVIFVNQLSPVMMASAAVAYKKRHKTKIALYCLDLWPESLVAGEISRSSFIYKCFKGISKKIYSAADCLLITSRGFADYFKNTFGIKSTQYLPQYAEDIFTPAICQKKPDGFFDVMLAGNIGAAQSVKTVIEAVKLTADNKEIRWHIVGDGTELESMKEQTLGLENIKFYGRKPLDEMPVFYSMADAMLVTMQRDETLSMTLPGRVQTYMAAGKPIICSANGETQIIVNEARCGLCGDAEDAVALADNIKKLARSTERETLGKNARAYYDAHFSKTVFIDKLEETLNNLLL